MEEDGIDDSSDGGWDEDVYDEDGSCFGVEHNAEVHDDVIDDYDDAADDDDDSDSDSDGEDSLPDVANLVEGISNVKTLHLSPYFLEVFDICCKSMPVFHKLLTLSFESDKERGWQVVPLLLKNSPNLETLVIKGLVHQVTDKCGDALQQIWARGWRRVWFEGDNQELCLIINQVKEHIDLGNYLCDIRHWMTLLPECSLEYVNREKNQVADAMSRHSRDHNSLYQFFDFPPVWLIQYLYSPFTV